MKYRLRLDLTFPTSATVADLQQAKTLLAPFFQNAIVVNEGQDNEERGFIELQECHHDESPPVSCNILELWEVGRGQVI